MRHKADGPQQVEVDLGAPRAATDGRSRPHDAPSGFCHMQGRCPPVAPHAKDAARGLQRIRQRNMARQ
eukprot:5464377-Alexandrium_andersonii.AAC.1